MDKDAVKLFAQAVGTKVEMVSSQGWAQCKCPLAPFTHDKGSDSKPSAAILVNKDGYSKFTCFTCEKHDLLSLVLRLREFGAKAPKYNLKLAMELVNAEDEQDLSLVIKDYDAPSAVEDDGNNDTVFSEEWLCSFLPALRSPLAMQYLKSRGVDAYTAHDLDIRWDTQRQTVCFPIRNFHGQLCGLRGRRISTKEGQPPYHMYKTKPGPEGKYNRMVWLGENRVDWQKPILLVESVFDYAACYPLYENVLAPLTVGMSSKKVKRIAAAPELVTLFDLGAGGNKARDLIKKYLPSTPMTHLLPFGPHRTQPGEEAKDPGEMRQSLLYDLLASHLPIDH